LHHLLWLYLHLLWLHLHLLWLLRLFFYLLRTDTANPPANTAANDGDPDRITERPPDC
jgi:hypothetical protein